MGQRYSPAIRSLRCGLNPGVSVYSTTDWDILGNGTARRLRIPVQVHAVHLYDQCAWSSCHLGSYQGRRGRDVLVDPGSGPGWDRRYVVATWSSFRSACGSQQASWVKLLVQGKL